MPLFFLLSGYFTMLVYSRRGLESLLRQRVARIAVPLLLATATIGPLDGALQRQAVRSFRPEPVIAEMLAGDADAVRRRFAAGADARGRDAVFHHPLLSWAACSNHADVVAAVIDAGADVNHRSAFGDTVGLGAPRGGAFMRPSHGLCGVDQLRSAVTVQEFNVFIACEINEGGYS
jgi:hypothetical protein